VTEAGETLGRLTAVNKGADRRGTWASFQKTFDPPLDLRAHQGMGVWVRGDGKGQVLNFQLQSPHHITRARGEHYVIVDFEGWRYFELIEPDAERFTDYAWPYHGWYSVYRESIQPSNVQSLTIWCNHLPPEDSITVDLRPVRAVPLVPAQIVNPQLTIGGATVEFPMEIPSGQYIEACPAGEVRRYGPAGELLEQLPLGRVLPQLVPGDNRIEFTCQRTESPPPRAQVQIRSLGEPIQ
jgi:hypothetical protein